jgi:hypothetical protein
LAEKVNAKKMELNPVTEDRLFASQTNIIPESGQLADTVDFDLLGPGMGKDVELALQTALSGGALFASGHDPIVIFRQALAASIRNIESHPRGRLFPGIPP